MAKANVLIVEDNRIVAEDLKNCLKKLGFGVSGIVSSGEEVGKKVEREQPDLVLMDIILEGEMDGVEAAEQLRSLYNIPVVYVTANADKNVFKRAKITEPFGYIVKPFDEIELSSTIEIALYKHKIEKKLKESENRFRQLATGTFEAVVLHNEGIILYANDQFYEMFGFEPHELAGRDAISLTIAADSLQLINKQVSLGSIGPYEVMGLKKSGVEFPIEIRGRNTEYKGQKVKLSAIRDLTTCKAVEQNLAAKVNTLEQLTAALNVLLDKRVEDQEELQENILASIKTLVEPYIGRLKESKLKTNQQVLLNNLESNLKEIISPFSKHLSSQYLKLTPKEVSVANFVKNGKTNKEIAAIQGVTSRTIASHRENIRKKLGLTNKKANLNTYLQTLE